MINLYAKYGASTLTRGARISLFGIRILSVSVTKYPYPYPYPHDRGKEYPYPIRIRVPIFP